MTVESRVRQIYERRPYPPPSHRETSTSWALAALPWLEAVSENDAAPPRRILVAGCGVGTEAFAFARAFPAAEVTGVDFSPRSIAAARREARGTGSRPPRFEVADLTDPALPDVAGTKFDLISCHGVLSYIRDTAAVLRNLARCLAPRGVLLLGVNGAGHPSLRWRPLLAGFGLDPGEFRESPRARRILRVFDSLNQVPPVPIADLPAGYLAGDLFGPLNRAMPLADWLAFSRPAGLHLVATYNAYFATRNLVNRDLHTAIMPRSRAEVATLVDAVDPASFLQIVLAKKPPLAVDWRRAGALLPLRPVLTPLYRIRWPKLRGPWHDLHEVVLESATTRTRVTLDVPRWEVRILMESDGTRSLREILKPVRPAVPARELSEAMYLLHHLAAIRLRPPER